MVHSVTSQVTHVLRFCASIFLHKIPPPTLQPIPDNVFIVAACNPHRSNSLASHISQKETWVRGSYYVRQLHPTLNFLMWDYGSLDENQERDYINAKMKLLNRQMLNGQMLNKQMLNREMSNAEVCGAVGVRVCEVCAMTCGHFFACCRLQA